MTGDAPHQTFDRRRGIRILRWICVIPGAALGWHVALLIGMTAFSVAESLCPADAVISGMCVAPWFRVFEAVLFVCGAALAAVLVVALATLIAPDHRVAVAWAAYGVGAAIAVFLGWNATATRELAAALLAGLAAAVILTLWERRKGRANTS